MEDCFFHRFGFLTLLMLLILMMMIFIRNFVFSFEQRKVKGTPVSTEPVRDQATK
jgi:hypothetical protein